MNVLQVREKRVKPTGQSTVSASIRRDNPILNTSDVGGPYADEPPSPGVTPPPFSMA